MLGAHYSPQPIVACPQQYVGGTVARAARQEPTLERSPHAAPVDCRPAYCLPRPAARQFTHLRVPRLGSRGRRSRKRRARTREWRLREGRALSLARRFPSRPCPLSAPAACQRGAGPAHRGAPTPNTDSLCAGALKRAEVVREQRDKWCWAAMGVQVCGERPKTALKVPCCACQASQQAQRACSLCR